MARFRKFLGVIIVASSSIVIPVIFPSPAAAQTSVEAVCLGAGEETYTPGLTNEKRAVTTVTAAETTCAPPGGSPAKVASFRFSYTFERSCTDTKFGGGNLPIDWGSGETSTVNFGAITVRAVGAAREVLLLGTMIDGMFQGAAVAIKLTLLAADFVACGTSDGVGSATGPAAIAVNRIL
ncbi:hypothetical protein [Amycolatopsis sp. cmx-11-12]|uniref:hypothetical protein n=1 Tax=Amycolatopsis sp. cmx-11-12 TaxID=2785795 RepID=UPI003917BC92